MAAHPDPLVDRSDDRRRCAEFAGRAHAFAALCPADRTGDPRFGGLALLYASGGGGVSD